MDTRILGFTIYNKNKKSLIEQVIMEEKVHIISGNPEVLQNGLNNPSLFLNFNDKQSIIIPDGIGTVVCGKIVGAPVKEKIAGIEVMEEIIKYCEEQKKGIYLLGAKREILEECRYNLGKKYPELMIVGSHDGYFDVNHCEAVLNNIQECKPYALFVAMGCPRQELFIIKYMNDLPGSIFMGVGGSFDIFANKVKRAPRWMIKLGLEWLYRVGKEPWRIKRLFVIPKFIIKVYFYRHQKY